MAAVLLCLMLVGCDDVEAFDDVQTFYEQHKGLIGTLYNAIHSHKVTIVDEKF